jgi:hypothetical protein
MKFTFQLFTTGNDQLPAGPLLTPLILDLSSIVEARGLIKKVVDNENVAADSVTIHSEDGTISEHWFLIDGSWTCKEA